jgi:hypothetical protein
MALSLCIAIVARSAITILPTGSITLAWTHTVEGTRWEEDYSVAQGALRVTEARIRRNGAGMDAPADASWSDGWWHYVPVLGPLSEVTLANSSFAPGYTVCWNGICRELRSIVPADEPATIAAAECSPTVNHGTAVPF